MRQLTVVSGKGGTGKTVVTASFAVLAREAVLADCDVDAADLHLLLQPEVEEKHQFSGGSVAVRDPEKCTECGECQRVCRFDAVNESFDIDPVACEGCGFCARACPKEAIAMRKQVNGEWFVSKTRCGPLVHARLGIAEENSGKLVTVVRKRAQQIAEERGARFLIADGPPGIGCPVIAAITGADFVLAVAEPTLSGIHDLDRVAGVAARFGVPAGCLVNKHDINPDNTRRIEDWCREHGVEVIGQVPFDDAVVAAMVEGRTVVEAGKSPAAESVKAAWQEVERCLEMN